VLDYFNSHPDKQGRVLTKYYPHGVSHHLGLDVHDPGDRTRPLEPGMVITVEPGLYIPEEKIGVRIEDDVLVTKDGYKLLTARLPRTADEIEKLMAEGRNKATKTTPCLFDPERGEVPGCIREEATGELFVAPDHLKDLAFDSGGLAAVRSPEYGWTYVDRNGKVLVRGVAVMDNGPDSFHDGLVRIVKYRKYGFASRDGRIVVPAVYDGALNFEQGLAAVCQGCKTKCVDPDCEYHSFNGGDWFQINKKGDVVGTLPARN